MSIAIPGSSPGDKPLLTAHETAARLRISERTLFTLTKERKLPTVRIGRRKLYDPQDVAQFIAASKAQHSAVPDARPEGGDQ